MYAMFAVNRMGGAADSYSFLQHAVCGSEPKSGVVMHFCAFYTVNPFANVNFEG